MNPTDIQSSTEQVVIEEDLRVVREPYDHLVRVKGKEVRGNLIDAFNSWFCVSDTDIHVVKTVIDKLHNASLL